MTTKTIMEWMLLGYLPIMAIMKTLLYYVQQPRGNPEIADDID